VSIFSPRAFSLRRVNSSLQGHRLTEEDAALARACQKYPVTKRYVPSASMNAG
jgi:hypothetical protein